MASRVHVHRFRERGDRERVAPLPLELRLLVTIHLKYIHDLHRGQRKRSPPGAQTILHSELEEALNRPNTTVVTRDTRVENRSETSSAGERQVSTE